MGLVASPNLKLLGMLENGDVVKLCLDWLKGCAVVMFVKKEGARKAIKTLNDTQFAGNTIRQ